MTDSPVTKLLAILTALTLGGCATDGATLPSVSCGVFHPLSYSRMYDTKQTVKGIIGHNAAYKSLCPSKQ